MLTRVVLVCFALCSFGVCAQEENVDYREVDTGQGRVRGYRQPGTDVYAFYSIPYATAPTGEHKFKAPLPPPSWNDTLEAVDKRIVCPQILLPAEFLNLTMQEDCLLANIFVPDTLQTNLPVVVVVHGGGFQLGFGNQVTYTNLVNSKQAIVVSFNYRLGLYGYLCLWNEDAPGNAGMKDQVALLRWVRDNIARFGGNPNDVTVSGCSSGAASTSLLILSKMTDGLIHKVMSESASNIGVLPVQFDPLQNAKDHALKLNFTNVNDIDALTEFYKGLTLDELIIDVGNMLRKDSSVGFVPCIEKENIVNETFLEEAPIKILRSKNFKLLPTIAGYSNLEGIFRYNMFYEWKDLMNEKFSDFLPADLEFRNEAEREEVATRIKQFYFGNRLVSNDTLEAYIDYFSDALLVPNVLFSARLQVEAGNGGVYLHEYSFNRNDRQVVPGRDLRGADHCDQFVAVEDEGDETRLPLDYQEMKAAMRQLWLDFIVTGNPTPPGRNNSLPTWPPLREDLSPHLILGPIIQVGNVPVEQRALFWNEIYEKYSRIPLSPNAAEFSSTVSKTLFAVVLTIFAYIRS